MKNLILTFLSFLLFTTITTAQPNFSTPQINPFGLTGVGQANDCRLVDIDADGDLDLFSFAFGGAFKYFENTAGEGVCPPAFSAPVDNPFGLTNAGSSWGMAIDDLNGDGLMDILLHSNATGWRFFENTGSASTPAFTESINPFGLSYYNLTTSAELGDIDGDGDKDLLVGTGIGPTWAYYENIGTAMAPSFAAVTTSFFGIDGTAGSIHFGNGGIFPNAPRFFDMNNDGVLDIVSGSDVGNGFIYWENTGTTNSPAFTSAYTSYPGPFGLSSSIVHGRLQLADFDGDGQKDALYGSHNSYRFQANIGDGLPGPLCGATAEAVPTMGEWALIIFALIIMTLGVVTVMRWNKEKQYELITK